MLLRFSQVSCSPFANFFLLKFTALYGEQTQWKDQVREIIHAIELPKSRFYKVVKELRALGILEVQEAKPTEVPQVRYRIKIDKSNVRSLALNKQPNLHQRKVDQLLTWNSQSISQRPHQLTIPQRVLMIALLEVADAGGIIRNVGFSVLAQRTGLTIRQVKNQMSKLREFHYVRASLPGGRSGLTGRYNSTHALNLRHPGFGRERVAGGVVIFRQAAFIIPDNQFNYFHLKRTDLLERLSKRKHASYRQNDQSDELLRLASRTTNFRRPSAWSFLSWICHDLASRALSELWNELSELSIDELNATIANKLRGEWLSAYRSIIEVDDDKNPGQHRAELSEQPDLPLLPLIETSMSNAVRHIAFGVQKALKDFEVLPEHAENYHFQILPTPHRGESGSFALEITSVDESQLAQTDAFAVAVGFNPKLGKLTVDRIIDVYEQKPSTLETTGLATPPLMCPILSKVPKVQK